MTRASAVAVHERAEGGHVTVLYADAKRDAARSIRADVDSIVR